jgi:uncharacterized BrkB/YihY/UPF0761 family membrane protein
VRAVLAKFFADRGTHLAAMIAYFALLSFVPLLFLALSLLGLAGRFDESSFLIHELERAFPGTEVIIHAEPEGAMEADELRAEELLTPAAETR